MSEDYPQPIVRKSPWYSKFFWLVPLAALVLAAFYARSYLRERGPTVTVRFTDAQGIKPRDTWVYHHGVKIGQVTGVELSREKTEARVEIRLRKDDRDFAQKGALYWIVKPQVSTVGLSGLNTFFSGPYIESDPGEGLAEKEFQGLEKAPEYYGEGVHITLHASHVGKVQEHSSIYYRGIEVGLVRDVRLAREGDNVEIQAVIWRRYAPLVREHSHFWILSGVDIQGGLFSGLEVKLGSLSTVFGGGIAFATPDKDMGDPVKDGAGFALEAESKKDWLAWAPKIPIEPTESTHEENPPALALSHRSGG